MSAANVVDSSGWLGYFTVSNSGCGIVRHSRFFEFTRAFPAGITVSTQHPAHIMQQWYYSQNSAQLGPVPLEVLKAKLASGEVSGNDPVWRDGMPDWKKASEVPELQMVSAPNVVPQPVPASIQPASPYQAPRAQSYPAQSMHIPNYLWQSIVVTILCCWPLGIPAIVYAAKVDGLKGRGDIQGAMAASNSAKTWCWVAFGLGLGVILIYLVVVASVGISGSRH